MKVAFQQFIVSQCFPGSFLACDVLFSVASPLRLFWLCWYQLSPAFCDYCTMFCLLQVVSLAVLTLYEIHVALPWSSTRRRETGIWWATTHQSSSSGILFWLVEQACTGLTSIAKSAKYHFDNRQNGTFVRRLLWIDWRMALSAPLLDISHIPCNCTGNFEGSSSIFFTLALRTYTRTCWYVARSFLLWVRF